MTQLGNIVYVVCAKSCTIKMYTADTLNPLGDGIHVEGMKDPGDIVACRRGRHLYVADWGGDCIWRVSVDDRSCAKWLTMDIFHPETLSLTSGRLLVTTSCPSSLRQYNAANRQELRVVNLPWYAHHAVETTRGTFVVCHATSQKDAVSEMFAVCLRRCG